MIVLEVTHTATAGWTAPEAGNTDDDSAAPTACASTGGMQSSANKSKPSAKRNRSRELVIRVTCGVKNVADFHLEKFDGVRKKAKCVLFQGEWMTTNEFKQASGGDKQQSWKNVLKHHDKSISHLEKKKYLHLDTNTSAKPPKGCRCPTCCPVGIFYSFDAAHL